jgi:hypothetical protein
MIDEVNETQGPPKWAKQQRVEDGFVFGLGVRRSDRSPAQDLYYAMRDARQSIGDWLDENQMPSARLVPPLPFDLSGISLLELAYDRVGKRWYALAGLDIGAEAERVGAEVAAVEGRLIRADSRVADSSLESDEQVRAALSILYDLERLSQYRAQYQILGGQAPEPPGAIDFALLQDHADNALSEHGVRVLVNGNSSDALYADLRESVLNAMDEVHIGRSMFGMGLISILLNESQSRRDGYQYLELGGEMQMNIEGGDAPGHTVPLRIVAIGSDLAEARFRAARDARKEVARIVRANLLEIASSGI